MDGESNNSRSAKKIIDKAELLRRVQETRLAGQTIVHCHGCFDIVHPGHVRYLEFARRQGDLLVVSLTGDSQIIKGSQRPYIPEELRAENLAALEAVNLVYIDPHPTASQLLSELRPDIYVKGHEYEKSHDPGFAAERAIVTGYGGRVLFSSGEVVFSSNRLIESLEHDSTLEIERLTLMCRRNGINRDSTDSLMACFPNLCVLIIGDVILDRYVLCDATDLASEAPIMSLSQLEEREYVGGAGVVARHIAGLGARPYLLSIAADDHQSRMVKKILENESIEAKLIKSRSRLPEKTRYLVETTKLLRVENAESQPLDSVAEQEAADWVEPIAGKLDAVIFCDFGYGAITSGLLNRLDKIFSKPVPIITADVSGPRAQLTRFRNAHLLCPTERELRLALHDFEQGLSSVAWNALNKTQARQLMVTLGKKGLVVFDRQSQDENRPEWRGRLRSEYLPSFADTVVDPLGCGDALLATATLAMAAGGNLMQSAYLGTVAAAIEIARLGNIPIDLDTLQRRLIGRIELTRSNRRPPSIAIRPTTRSETPKRLQPARTDSGNVVAYQKLIGERIES